MVKQARKSEKRKSFGNNLENGYNGRPNYLDLQGNKENVDRGSQKGKYKRLEEMRKKRVDITVTSDEEQTTKKLSLPDEFSVHLYHPDDQVTLMIIYCLVKLFVSIEIF
jgi:hypothetical protein